MHARHRPAPAATPASCARWPSYAISVAPPARSAKSPNPLPDEVPAAVASAEAMVFSAGESNLGDTVAPADALLADGLDHLEALYQRGDTIAGIPAGFYDHDVALSDLHGGHLLIVLVARPAVDKSACALDVARHAAFDHRRPTLVVFSLEMTRKQITLRLFAAEARIDLTRIRKGRLTETDWPKLSSAIARIKDSPLFVDDKRDVTIVPTTVGSGRPPR